MHNSLRISTSAYCDKQSIQLEKSISSFPLHQNINILVYKTKKKKPFDFYQLKKKWVCEKSIQRLKKFFVIFIESVAKVFINDLFSASEPIRSNQVGFDRGHCNMFQSPSTKSNFRAFQVHLNWTNCFQNSYTVNQLAEWKATKPNQA